MFEPQNLNNNLILIGLVLFSITLIYLLYLNFVKIKDIGALKQEIAIIKDNIQKHHALQNDMMNQFNDRISAMTLSQVQSGNGGGEPSVEEETDENHPEYMTVELPQVQSEMHQGYLSPEEAKFHTNMHKKLFENLISQGLVGVGPLEEDEDNNEDNVITRNVDVENLQDIDEDELDLHDEDEDEDEDEDYDEDDDEEEDLKTDVDVRTLNNDEENEGNDELHDLDEELEKELNDNLGDELDIGDEFEEKLGNNLIDNSAKGTTGTNSAEANENKDDAEDLDEIDIEKAISINEILDEGEENTEEILDDKNDISRFLVEEEEEEEEEVESVELNEENLKAFNDYNRELDSLDKLESSSVNLDTIDNIDIDDTDDLEGIDLSKTKNRKYLNMLNVKQLRALCKKYDIKSRGNKNDLVRSIINGQS